MVVCAEVAVAVEDLWEVTIAGAMVAGEMVAMGKFCLHLLIYIFREFFFREINFYLLAMFDDGSSGTYPKLG